MQSRPAFRLDPLRLARASRHAEEALAWAQAATPPEPVLIYATARRRSVKTVQRELGAERAGQLVEQALARIAQGLVQAGVRRLVVAGGETAGAVVGALGMRSLRIGPQIDPGVPWTESLDAEPIALALKSGNFGSPDFFARRWRNWSDSACRNTTLREQHLRARQVDLRSRPDPRLDRQHQRALRGWLAADADGLQPRSAGPGTPVEARLERQADLRRPALQGELPASRHVPGARRQCRPSIHLHATHSVAVSVLEGLDPEDLLPPLTAYYVMRIGTLPLVPYYAPGDMALAEAVRGYAGRHHALLLANHGPVVAGTSLAAAADAIEELEATAKLYLLLQGQRVRPLTEAQVADIRRRYPLTLSEPSELVARATAQAGGRRRHDSPTNLNVCGHSATKFPTPCAYSVHKGGSVALGGRHGLVWHAFPVGCARWRDDDAGAGDAQRCLRSTRAHLERRLRRHPRWPR